MRPAHTLEMVCVLAAGLTAPAPGHADTFTATLGQPLREVSHAVELRLEDGVATYTVRRS
ncbi:secreted protein, partial [sediment metagenome]